jgi:hypothetical protein
VPKLLRFPQTFGSRGKIPVGHSKAYEDFIYHPGGDPYVTGTKIPRLRRVPLGERAVAFHDSAVDAIVEGLVALSEKV